MSVINSHIDAFYIFNLRSKNKDIDISPESSKNNTFETCSNIKITNDLLEQIESFVYLGILLHKSEKHIHSQKIQAFY